MDGFIVAVVVIEEKRSISVDDSIVVMVDIDTKSVVDVEVTVIYEKVSILVDDSTITVVNIDGAIAVLLDNSTVLVIGATEDKVAVVSETDKIGTISVTHNMYNANNNFNTHSYVCST